ncbi:undecaprenyl/decaprenyl-phosphate alpha-N-acetylglucosaminyl 1-phosphate transferase [Flavobacteriaceae bacterium]|nr:undecaprenyl/decaprenyl-phosphate alpha-N-acetylglucosaminyl 1-phosphate transferase [Flavobacteriaceae bacterium]
MCFLVFVLSGILTYFTQKIFIHYKKFDDFNHRSSHKTLATRTGGIGVFATLLIISSYYYFNKVELFDYSLFIPLSTMFIVGVYDDFYHADFKLKFLLQIIVAKIIIDQGYAITNYHGLFGLYEVPWLLAQLSTLFVFLVIINAINFIDGIDGLAITEVIKTIILIELFSASATPITPFSIILILSLIPLYYFNFKKSQKVFLGDSGSLLLGTIVSIYIFYALGNEYQFKEGFQMNKVLFTLLVMAYPLIDLLRVFILRIKENRSPFVADQKHLHHLILKKTKKQVITTLIITMCSLLIFTLIFLIKLPLTLY